MKTKNVTKEILSSVQKILADYSKDFSQLAEGVNQARHYLKDNVENKGLYAYVTTTINNPHADNLEKILCTSLYDELNKFDYDVKTDIVGEN